MRYFITSLDTNGINIKYDNVIAICLQEIDFTNNVEKIGDDLTVLLKDYDVKDTTRYHGFTNNDLAEFGMSHEEAQMCVLEYMFNVDENVDTSKICLVGVNIDKFLLPFLNKFFGDDVLSDVKTLDISSAMKVMLNADSFSEALDILQITSPNDNCFNKVSNIFKVIQMIRRIINE